MLPNNARNQITDEVKNAFREVLTGHLREGFEPKDSYDEAVDVIVDLYKLDLPFNQRENGTLGKEYQYQMIFFETQKPTEFKQEEKPKGKQYWIDLMRELAETGFIPYKQYVKPFIPEVKYDNWSSWKKLLEYEGYEFEASEFGWITIAKPQPKPLPVEEILPPKQPEINFEVTRELVETITAEFIKQLRNGGK